MNYTILGNTDLQISKICLGTMTFGQQNTESEAIEQLDYAVQEGINFIDVAEMYPVPSRKETQGSTEQFIGNWHKARNNRKDLIIATKVTGPNKGLSFIRENLNFGKAHMQLAIEGSLKRLQTDYIDIYQLHWPERNTNFFGKLGYVHKEDEQWQDNFLDVLQTLQELKNQGKIRHWGLSNEVPWGVSRFLHIAEKNNLTPCISIQNPYSLLNRTYEVGLAEISMRENLPLLAYSPLAFGVLSGKYLNAQPENARITLFPQFSRYTNKQAEEAVKRYVALARKYDLTPALLALAFVNTRPFVGANIIGATSMEQLKENIQSCDINISNELLQEIEQIHREFPNPAP